VIELAKRRGYPVVERAIQPEELSGFSECFLTGSAAEVTPVSEIGPYKFTPATISETLMNDYMKEVYPGASIDATDCSVNQLR
jgi:branched-chain amino acid aminotransferase